MSQLLRLNARVQGTVTGIVFGGAIFVATNWLLLKGGPLGPDGRPIVGVHLALLGQYFIGYRVTFIGSLIGLGYGFVSGFAVGYFVSRLYNWIADVRAT